MTYFIPAGSYERIHDEESNQNLVVANTYQTVDQEPVSFIKLPGYFFDSFVEASDIIAFVFIVAGAFAIINFTGTINSLTTILGKRYAQNEKVLIPIFLSLFSIFGFTFGMSTEVVAFVPLGIALALSLGFDRVTGAAMVMVGALSGYTAGILNPFNVGIAQIIAELPLFSGLAYRIVVLIVLLLTANFFISRYALKVKEDPTKSVVFGLDEYSESEYLSDDIDHEKYNGLTIKNKIVLLILLFGFSFLVYGVVKQGWWLTEMAGLFLTLGIVCGLASGLSINRVAIEFVKGARMVVEGCLMIGFAFAIQTVMNEGLIIDSIVYYISNTVAFMPDFIKPLGMYLSQSLLNIVLTSSNIQAAVVMPVMVPVADLVGVSRQMAVLAFQLGDGISNILLPTWATLMSVLAVAKVPFEKWFKFAYPLAIAWIIGGALLMIGATFIGY